MKILFFHGTVIVIPVPEMYMYFSSKNINDKSYECFTRYLQLTFVGCDYPVYAVLKLYCSQRRLNYLAFKYFGFERI